MTPSLQSVSIPGDLQKASEDMFRLLAELKDYAIVILDPTGNIISSNAGVQHIFGFLAAEIKGKHISVLYSPEEIQNKVPLQNLEKAVKNGAYEHEEQKMRTDGSTFYANTVLTTLRNEDNSIRGFAKVTRDITIQKKLEAENNLLTGQLEEKVKQRTKELETANKELEAFSYSVSHDLRTPLRAISGYSAMLQEDYEDKLDPEGKRIINVIIDNTKMMGDLIDDLLSFSKMSKLKVINTAIDMKDLAQKCTYELLQIEKRKDYQVIIHDLPLCKGDLSMLKQVFQNLIGNSIKYSARKATPRIEIGAIESDDNYTYFVKDNGAGFDMKYSGKLFGVFQRLHRRDEFEGTGLGLALSKRIITKHGGEIWAEASLNEGATFYFSIPKNN